MTGTAAAAPLAAARAELARGVALAALLTVGILCGALVVPLYDMNLFDRVLVSRSLDSMVALALACALGLVLHAIFSALRGVVLATAAERAVRRVSGPLRAVGLRRAVGGGRDGQAAASRALADLQEVRAFLSGTAAAAPLDLALAPLLLAALFVLHPALGWYGTAAACAMLACALLTDGAARPRMALAQRGLDGAIAEAASLLHDRTLTEGLGMGPAIAARWRRRQGEALGVLAAAVRWGEAMAAAARTLRAMLQGGAIALAAMLVLRHEATPGAVVGANLMLAMLLAPLDSVLAHWRAVAGARSAWQRLGEALAEGPVAPARAVPVLPPPQGIALEAVTFHPAGAVRAPVVAATLRVMPGEIVALTGPNGAGKSSLARLAAGILAPTSGRASAAGLPAEEAAAAGMIGYLPQRAQILEGTVAETIARLQPDPPPEALVAAARAAGLHEAIGRLPAGYATRTGPLDPVFSGGETQRLALARALYGDPPVLIVDEPDAALDHAGEAVLAGALVAARARGAAVLAVTHRRALLALADRVLRVAEGRILEDERETQDGA